MKLLSLKCPNCNGSIKLDSDFNKQTCYCPHCGSVLLIDDEISRSEHKSIIIDEAEIQKAQIQKAIDLRRIDTDEKKFKFQSGLMKVKVCVSIICGILGIACILIMAIFGAFTFDFYPLILAVIFFITIILMWVES